MYCAVPLKKCLSIFAGIFILCASSVTHAQKNLEHENNQLIFNLALEKIALGEYQLARDMLGLLLTRTQSPRVKLEFARAAFLGGDFEVAEHTFKEVLKLDPPMMVRERIFIYLDEISLMRGRIDYSIGITRDTNPKSVTYNRVITIFGQPFNFNPSFDTSTQYGLSYAVSGSRAMHGMDDLIANFSISGADFPNSSFDRSLIEAGLMKKLSTSPKIYVRTSVERFTYENKTLYDASYIGLRHRAGLPDQTFFTNDIKAGKLSYPDYNYLDASIYTLFTQAGKPVSENIIAGFDLTIDRVLAKESAYSYRNLSPSGFMNFYAPSFFIKGQARATIAKRNYDGVDPFFGTQRNDRRELITLSLSKTDWKIFGAYPVIEVGLEKNTSNFDLYSYKRELLNLWWKKIY